MSSNRVVEVSFGLGISIVIGLLLAGTASAAIGKEFKITNDIGNQIYARIHENRIVYMNQTDPDCWEEFYDIHVYDLGADGIFNTSDDGRRVAVNDYNLDEFYPDLYGDLVPYSVGEWADWGYPHYLSEDINISLFDLSSNVTANISIAPGYQCCLKIYNITLVWHDRRGWHVL